MPSPTQIEAAAPTTALKGSPPATTRATIAAMAATTSAAIRAGRNCFSDARQSLTRQRKNGPNGINAATGSINRTNMKPKYGGPTEMRPMFNASPSNGYNVPSSTIAAAQTNMRLLMSSTVSRDTAANGSPPATFGARNA